MAHRMARLAHPFATRGAKTRDEWRTHSPGMRRTSSRMAPRSPVDVIQTGNGLLDTLNGSTRSVTFGQIRILGELEQALRGYLERQLAAVPGGH